MRVRTWCLQSFSMEHKVLPKRCKETRLGDNDCCPSLVDVQELLPQSNSRNPKRNEHCLILL